MPGAGVQRSEETLEKLSKWQASPLANACSLPVNPLLSLLLNVSPMDQEHHLRVC